MQNRAVIVSLPNWAMGCCVRVEKHAPTARIRNRLINRQSHQSPIASRINRQSHQSPIASRINRQSPVASLARRVLRSKTAPAARRFSSESPVLLPVCCESMFRTRLVESSAFETSWRQCWHLAAASTFADGYTRSQFQSRRFISMNHPTLASASSRLVHRVSTLLSCVILKTSKMSF